MHEVYNQQGMISTTVNFDKIHFYVYTKDALSSGCGTVRSDAVDDMPCRDDDAVLHTKAFLHEIRHAVFGLADEYDGVGADYFECPEEPNIFLCPEPCLLREVLKPLLPIYRLSRGLAGDSRHDHQRGHAGGDGKRWRSNLAVRSACDFLRMNGFHAYKPNISGRGRKGNGSA